MQWLMGGAMLLQSKHKKGENILHIVIPKVALYNKSQDIEKVEKIVNLCILNNT